MRRVEEERERYVKGWAERERKEVGSEDVNKYRKERERMEESEEGEVGRRVEGRV